LLQARHASISAAQLPSLIATYAFWSSGAKTAVHKNRHPWSLFACENAWPGAVAGHFRFPQRLHVDRDSDAPRNKAAAPTRELRRPHRLLEKRLARG
jgi:hypothetical protein